jgi:hypothetical protein
MNIMKKTDVMNVRNITIRKNKNATGLNAPSEEKAAVWNRITLLMKCLGCRHYKLSKNVEKHKEIRAMRECRSGAVYNFILVKFYLLFKCPK